MKKKSGLSACSTAGRYFQRYYMLPLCIARPRWDLSSYYGLITGLNGLLYIFCKILYIGKVGKLLLDIM